MAYASDRPHLSHQTIYAKAQKRRDFLSSVPFTLFVTQFPIETISLILVK